MSTITKELAKLFRKITNSEIDAEGNAHVVLSPDDSLLINNARIALASLEAEAVGTFKKGPCGYHPSFHEDAVPLYTAPPAPANAEPVAWLWSHRKHPSEVSLVRPEDDERAEGVHWSGWSCQALYAAPPAPISVPDEVCWEDVPEEITEDDMALASAWAHGFNQCRAAMLQGADGTLTNEGTITATQFKPVADLYGLTSPTGGETSFTFDAVEARDFIDGGWSCQEYVELERFQEAVSGNSPVIPDGFCIMPKKLTAENGGKGALSGEFHVTNRIVCQSCGGEGCEDCNDEGGLDAEIPVSWDTIKRIHEAAVEACSLPAAPQQEVTQALAKGMERYGDAMQKLADSGD